MPTSIPERKSIAELEEIARRLRGVIVGISNRCGIAHLGSCLSCVDLLVASYWHFLKIDPSPVEKRNRDKFILSKGHAITALYAVLAEKKFFPPTLLEQCGTQNSFLAEHPCPNCVPGIDAVTGSLGHGLSIGLGLGLAARIKKQSFKTCVLMGDGECNEGSVWEAALFGAAHNISNVVCFVDYNKWQATGRSDDVLGLAPLKNKWQSFGWHCAEIDGHDINAIVNSLNQLPQDKPSAIIAHTVKGKGVSFMEDDNNWHYRIPTDQEVTVAYEELGLR